MEQVGQVEQFNPDDPKYLEKKITLMQQRGKNSYSYLSQPRTRVCPVCGEVFEAPAHGRPKRFCSEKCRTYYHHRYPNTANWTSTRIAVCPVCGKEFQASREYNHPRKYCSHACANKARAMIRKGLMKDKARQNDEGESQ